MQQQQATQTSRTYRTSPEEPLRTPFAVSSYGRPNWAMIHRILCDFPVTASLAQSGSCSFSSPIVTYAQTRHDSILPGATFPSTHSQTSTPVLGVTPIHVHHPFHTYASHYIHSPHYTSHYIHSHDTTSLSFSCLDDTYLDLGSRE